MTIADNMMQLGESAAQILQFNFSQNRYLSNFFALKNVKNLHLVLFTY